MFAINATLKIIGYLNMPRGMFDAEGFFAVLDGHRIQRNVTWRQIAKESGVSPSTLTRMAQGKRPDVDSLVSLLAWSGESADSFMVVDGEKPVTSDALANVTAQFRKDPRLPPEAKAAIEATVKALYEQFTKTRKAK
ncbi:helix-turn-helix protein [Rosistilla oblonga]|uniref:helix-turn-helix domain-containing protein n=1 Tax=Rosistilla oblonga TaxID=2527990 RepID=UPI00118C2DA5|nr:helix-turn-helix transcriptional regulator [Rosistilla oblonga]QDV14135.1 helix-turn-helix protein [Rosistilla oblonga]